MSSVYISLFFYLFQNMNVNENKIKIKMNENKGKKLKIIGSVIHILLYKVAYEHKICVKFKGRRDKANPW